MKANDNHILGSSDYLLEQQKEAAEVERWEKERMEESESQRQLKRQRLECERRQVESDCQSWQQKEQRRAHQQQQQEHQAQEHREEQLNRYYEEQAATQSAERRKATEVRVRVAEEDSKARGARGERSLKTPKHNLIQSTPALVKPPKESVIQSKLAVQIVTTIHTKKKNPRLTMNITISTLQYLNKTEILARRFIQHKQKRTIRNERRKYSIGHVYQVERVGRVARIRRQLERRLECR